MRKNLQRMAVFVRSALVAAAFPFLLLNVIAQAPAFSPTSGTAEVERVIATGSIIPKPRKLDLIRVRTQS